MSRLTPAHHEAHLSCRQNQSCLGQVAGACSEPLSKVDGPDIPGCMGTGGMFATMLSCSSVRLRVTGAFEVEM